MASRTLFVGDVHGCSHELRSLLSIVRPTKVVLVGDLFTRGPDPQGVWRAIQKWKCEAVLGNHDAAVLASWTPGAKLPKKAFRWLKALPYMIRTKHWIAVHAGINPEHPKRTSKREALHLRDWPTATGMRPWWKVYRGRRLVVHGHHAREGLADRRPRVIGLDTNCVGGGSLSGYLLERDEVVSIKARRYAGSDAGVRHGKVKEAEAPRGGRHSQGREVSHLWRADGVVQARAEG